MAKSLTWRADLVPCSTTKDCFLNAIRTYIDKHAFTAIELGITNKCYDAVVRTSGNPPIIKKS